MDIDRDRIDDAVLPLMQAPRGRGRLEFLGPGGYRVRGSAV